MSSMEPEKKKDSIKILLSRKDAYIFYDHMCYIPLCDPTTKEKDVFDKVMDQLQFQIGE